MESHGSTWTCLAFCCFLFGLVLPVTSSTVVRSAQPHAAAAGTQIITASVEAEEYSTFLAEDPEWTFNHLAVDYRNGNVYIGAVNRIYKLSPSLEVQKSHQTGPDRKSTRLNSSH